MILRGGFMIKIKVLKENVKLPKKEYDGDAGFDVYSLEDITLKPFDRYKFGLGFAVEFPDNYVMLVADKSGLAFNDGIITIGNVIDSRYRGEIHVVLINISNVTYQVKKCQKIAQIMLMSCYTEKIYDVVNQLSESERGSSGFGSTGL
jgi:dUTP pyrophosphatase